MSNLFLNSNPAPANTVPSNPKIGILVPTLLEHKCLTRKRDNNIYQVITGMGKVNATLSASRAIIYEECDVILLVGFCGALQGLKVNDVVHPNIVIEADFNAGTLEEYPRKNYCLRDYEMPGEKSCFMTADKFIKYRDEFQVFKDIEKRFPVGSPIAVDMESWGAMQSCIRFGAHFESVRIVSDIIGENTEDDFLEACKTLSKNLNSSVEQAIESIRRYYGQDR